MYMYPLYQCLLHRMFEWIHMYRDIEELIMLTLQLEEAFENKVSFDCRLSLHDAAHTHTHVLYTVIIHSALTALLTFN